MNELACAKRNTFIHLKRIRGWETLEMVQKYAHLNAGQLSQFSNAVTIWSQNESKDNQHLGWWS